MPSSDQTILRKLISTQDIKSIFPLNLSYNFFYLIVGKETFIFIHFGSQDSLETLNSILERVFTNKKCYHIWTNSKHIPELTKLVFEAWREGE